MDRNLEFGFGQKKKDGSEANVWLNENEMKVESLFDKIFRVYYLILLRQLSLHLVLPISIEQT